MMTKIKHLYIHVPFCNSICNYCDFCHVVYNEKIVEQWLDVLKDEIDEKCHDQYETIYIGGGTPSCLNINQLEKLFNLIKPYTNNVIEYTIEVNPESVTNEKIILLKKFNVNRVSIGVQSSNDVLLKSLNRKHSYNDVINTVNLLKSNNINNISIDLMYSLPNQSLSDLKNTLNDFINLDIPHISIYALTVEENTIFGKKGIKPLDNDIEADMYELIEDTLLKEGYIHYEVSNYCKNGYESKHNLGYWLYKDFLGLSLGASSKIGNKRWTNTFSFNEYFNNYNSKSEALILSQADLRFENIMMSLRTNLGLNIDEFNRKYNCDFISKYKDALNNSNLLIKNGVLYCTNLELLNSILINFME